MHRVLHHLFACVGTILFSIGLPAAAGSGEPASSSGDSREPSDPAEQGHEYARRLLQYVRAQPNTELPACLMPDRVEAIQVVVVNEPPASEIDDRAVLRIRVRPEIEALVKQLAPQYAIDPQLAMAVI